MWSEELNDTDSEDSDDDGNDGNNVTDEDDSMTLPELLDPVDEQPKLKVRGAQGNGWLPPSIEPPKLPSKAALLQRLRRDIDESTDKLFFVRSKQNGKYHWKVGQVVTKDSNPHAMKTYGQYRMRWFIPNSTDAETLSTTDCQFWADFRTLQSDLSLGRQAIVKPSKAEGRLRDSTAMIWAQDDVNLAEDRIVGPFNFEKRRIPGPGRTKTVSNTSFIPEATWNKLERLAGISSIDASQIRLPPHNKRPTLWKSPPSKKRKEPPTPIEQSDGPKTVKDMPSMTKVSDITYNPREEDNGHLL